MPSACVEEIGMTASAVHQDRFALEPVGGVSALDRIPPILSVIAGMVEVIGFLMLGGLFTGHVTGNIVLIAALLVRGGSPTAPQILAVPTFIGALVVFWLIARATRMQGAALVRVLLFTQFLLLFGVLILAINPDFGTDPNNSQTSVAAILATSAMACQFATLRLAVPGAPSTAVMTGNLTNSVLSFLDVIQPGRALAQPDVVRFRKAATLLVGFCAGCTLGALACLLLKNWSWTLPVVIAACAMALVRHPVRSQD
jgi:uncharacterized membrane protein YoaK (UPF0700 family)